MVKSARTTSELKSGVTLPLKNQFSVFTWGGVQPAPFYFLLYFAIRIYPSTLKNSDFSLKPGLIVLTLSLLQRKAGLGVNPRKKQETLV